MCFLTGVITSLTDFFFFFQQAIGESLFTVFVSLAQAIQFLMELQTYHF